MLDGGGGGVEFQKQPKENKDYKYLRYINCQQGEGLSWTQDERGSGYP